MPRPESIQWLARKSGNPSAFMNADPKTQQIEAQKIFNRRAGDTEFLQNISPEDLKAVSTIFNEFGVDTSQSPSFSQFMPAQPEAEGAGWPQKIGEGIGSVVGAYEKYVPSEIQNLMSLAAKGFSAVPVAGKAAIAHGAATKSPIGAVKGAAEEVGRLFGAPTYTEGWEDTSLKNIYGRMQGAPVEEQYVSPKARAHFAGKRPADLTPGQESLMAGGDIMSEFVGDPLALLGGGAVKDLLAVAARKGQKLAGKVPTAGLNLLGKGRTYQVAPKAGQAGKRVAIEGRPWRHPVGQRKVTSYTQAAEEGPWRATPHVTGKESLIEQIMGYVPPGAKKVVGKKAPLRPPIPTHIQTGKGGMETYRPFSGGVGDAKLITAPKEVTRLNIIDNELVNITDDILADYSSFGVTAGGWDNLFRGAQGIKRWNSLSKVEQVAEVKASIAKGIPVVKQEILESGKSIDEYLLDIVLDPLHPHKVFYGKVLERMGYKVIPGKSVKRLKSSAAIVSPQKALVGKRVAGGIEPYRPFGGGAPVDRGRRLVPFEEAAELSGVIPKAPYRSLDEQIEQIAKVGPEGKREFIPEGLRQIGRSLSEQFSTPARILEKSPVGRYFINQTEKMKRGKSMFEHKFSTELAEKTGRLTKTEEVDAYNMLQGTYTGSNAETMRKAALHRQNYEDLWNFGVEKGMFDVDKVEKLENYAPRLYDVEKLLPVVRGQIKQISGAIKSAAAKGTNVDQYQQQLKALNDMALRLSGGELFTPIQSISNIGRLPYAMQRKLKSNDMYIKNASQAMGAYVRGMARHIYDKPVLKELENVFSGVELDGVLQFLPDEHVHFAHEYAKNLAGAHRLTMSDKVFGLVRGFEFARLIGGSPRSAITNLTQQINNFAGLGFAPTGKAMTKYIMNDEAPKVIQDYFGAKGWRDVFRKSGLADEIKYQFVGSAVPRYMQKINDSLGYFFSKAEEFNKGTAWVGSLEKSLKAGNTVEQALETAFKNTRDWQFFYGKQGLPAALRKPSVATLMQFWSFSIKQGELLLTNINKVIQNRDPEAMKFLARYFGMAAGGGLFAQKVLGLNLNNSLGLGVDMDELLEALKSLKDEDFQEMLFHTKRGLAALNPLGGQPGLIPSGPGPAVGHLEFVKDWDRLGFELAIEKHLMPLQLQRIREATPAGGTFGFGKLEPSPATEGKYITRDPRSGMSKYELSPADIIKRTLIGKPQDEFEQQRIVGEGYRTKVQERDYLMDIRKAYQQKDMDKVRTLIDEATKKGFNMRKVRGLLRYQRRAQDIPKAQLILDKYKNVNTYQ